MFQIDEFAAAVLADFPDAYVYEQDGLILVQIGLLGLTDELAETIFLAGHDWGLTYTRWSVRLGSNDQLVLTTAFKHKEQDPPFRVVLLRREKYQQIRQLARHIWDNHIMSNEDMELIALVLEHFKEDE